MGAFLAITPLLHTSLTSKLLLLTTLLCCGHNLLLLVSKHYYYLDRALAAPCLFYVGCSFKLKVIGVKRC